MRVTFDSNVFITYRVNPNELARSVRFSAVVIQALTAGAWDGVEVRVWEALRAEYEAAGRLLVPTGEDWFFAGKVLNSLMRDPSLRRKIAPDEQRRLVRDTLIQDVQTRQRDACNRR